MEYHYLTEGIEFIAKGIETFGIAIIAVSFLRAILLFFIGYFGKKRESSFNNIKIYIGRSLQLALEFLVAADIIRTVTIEMTREAMITLGLLIMVRTALSWSITVETEGCWPWKVSKKENA